MINILVNNTITSSTGPPKINIVVPQSTKVGELKDLIGMQYLNEEKAGKELSLFPLA